MNHLYLHGFASGPTSRKAVAVGQALAKLGTRLDAPDLNDIPAYAQIQASAAKPYKPYKPGK